MAHQEQEKVLGGRNNFCRIKKRGVNAELVNEFAKDKTWKGNALTIPLKKLIDENGISYMEINGDDEGYGYGMAFDDGSRGLPNIEKIEKPRNSREKIFS